MTKYGYKAYHKYKVQKMSDEHKERRVECARMFLSVYGRRLRNDRKWEKIINTDFSAKITTYGQKKMFGVFLRERLLKKNAQMTNS